MAIDSINRKTKAALRKSFTFHRQNPAYTLNGMDKNI